jgi:hypothetical protein
MRYIFIPCDCVGRRKESRNTTRSKPEDQLAWRQMRLRVADLHRRSEVSQKANNRYLDAFAALDDTTCLDELIRPLEQPCRFAGRGVRALRPFQTDDHALLKAVHRGEFALNGFRNRDLQRLLYPEPKLFRSANGDGAPWR